MGCVHVYCGDGKGKTSAALGLALRAAGRGWRVVVARFLKNDDSGELLPLCGIPGVEVLPCEKSFGFYRTMTDAEKAEAGEYYRELLERAWRRAEAGGLLHHISIHAPLTGSDTREIFTTPKSRHFNPRSPYGERHSHLQGIVVAPEFQSTLPLRGATMSEHRHKRQK